MNKGSGKVLEEKPVIIVRRKVGTKSSPSGPTQLPPRVSAPTMKATASATAPPPPPEPQPPVPQLSPAAPAIIESSPSEKEQKKQARRELLEVFRERWPHAFPRDLRQVRPLAVGIHRDLAAALPGHSHRQIGAVFSLFKYLVNPAYLRAILRGGPRYDLDGNPRGEVTAKEQEQARQDLHAYFEQRKRKATASDVVTHEETARAEGGENKQ